MRFGIVNSTLWANVTTDTSCGAVNSMHDSFTPIAGLVPLLNMMTDIVIFGGVGAGLYGILIYCIIAVFIAGLMVGRTPEYLGKKLEKKEVKMAMLAIIATSASVLLFSAISSQINFPAKGYWNAPGAAIANLGNSGPHGLSEILYAYASGTGNNGSAFAGLNANTPWYNLTIGLAMLIGRFLFLIPILAVAGSLAAKKKVAGHQRDVPHSRTALRRATGWHGRHRSRADVFPGDRAGADRRAFSDAQRQAVFLHPVAVWELSQCPPSLQTASSKSSAPQDDSTSLLPKKLARSRPLFDPRNRETRDPGLVREAEPGHVDEEPGDVRGRGRRRADHGVPDPRHIHRGWRDRVLHPDFALALVHGPVRQLRRSHGRGPRKGAGGQPAQDQDGRSGKTHLCIAGRSSRCPLRPSEAEISCSAMPAT